MTDESQSVYEELNLLVDTPKLSEEENRDAWQLLEIYLEKSTFDDEELSRGTEIIHRATLF